MDDKQDKIRKETYKLIEQKVKYDKMLTTINKKLQKLQSKCDHPKIKTSLIDSHTETSCPDCDFWQWEV